MLFLLQRVNSNIEKAHEIPKYFFEQLKKNSSTNFGLHLFPTWVQSDDFKFLRDHFEIFFNSLKSNISNQTDIIKICEIFSENNEIEKICSDINQVVTCIDEKKLISLYKDIDKYIDKLFDWLYGSFLNSRTLEKKLNTSLKKHYEDFADLNSRTCVFCGIHEFSLPIVENRQSYDHYLAKSIYPFSSINFDNLIPICGQCNTIKSDENIVYEDYKTLKRRVFFYPYKAHNGIKILLNCNRFPLNIKDNGNWNVSVNEVNTNDKEKLIAWKKVFNIESRFTKYIEVKVGCWFEEFIKDFKTSNSSISKFLNDLENKNKIDIKAEAGIHLKQQFIKILKNYLREVDFIFKSSKTVSKYVDTSLF